MSKTLLNKKIESNAPRTIGHKNKKFFLILLKKCNILSTIFSYKPNITKKTPLLIPGKIAPAPINIPIKKFFKKSPNKNSIYIKFFYVWLLQ